MNANQPTPSTPKTPFFNLIKTGGHPLAQQGQQKFGGQHSGGFSGKQIRSRGVGGAGGRQGGKSR